MQRWRYTFHIAWPVWAGGYPTPKRAAERLGSTLPARGRLQDAIRLVFSSLEKHGRFATSVYHIEAAGYRAMAGLQPPTPVDNSITLTFELGVEPVASLLPRIRDWHESLIPRLGDALLAASIEALPGANAGANLYEISGTVERIPQGSELLFPLRIDLQAPPARPSPQALVERASARPDTGGPASRRTRVFISYSHRDARWLERLQIHLKPLARDHGIDIWDDTRIEAGDRWHAAIEAAMNEAAVAILLVSANFLASDFVARNELPPLLAAASANGTLILPVIVSASLFASHPELTRFQTVNDPALPLDAMKRASREKVLADLAGRVQRHFAARR